MAGNRTLQRAIERCEKRLSRARNKLRCSKSELDRDAARKAIQEQESKILRLRQQIIFNRAQRDIDAK